MKLKIQLCMTGINAYKSKNYSDDLIVVDCVAVAQFLLGARMNSLYFELLHHAWLRLYY